MDENKTVEEVIIKHRRYSDDAAKLNGAGEYWNWSFMWLCLYPYVCPLLVLFFDFFNVVGEESQSLDAELFGCLFWWLRQF
jgi:hypothetical protein